MKFRYTYLLICLLMSVGGIQSLSADSFDEIYSVCKKGKTVNVTEDLFVEGIVISDWKNANMEVNPNKSHTAVDLTQNAVTAYIQLPDGSRGIRLKFEDESYNRFSRFDVVKLNLKGAVLRVSSRTGAVTVSALTPANVVAYRHGSDEELVVKEKHISELTDADIYTWVTLKDVEFIFKDGTYADIQETYGQRVEKYHSGYKSVNARMDGWVTSLRDINGDAIYMMVNSSCDWRRDGDGVPGGMGDFSGIVVSSRLRRFGESIGRYSIRPLDKNAFSMTSKKPMWKLLTGFILDGSLGQTLFFEKAGEVQNLNKKKFSNDRILSDSGSESYLWTDTGAEIRLVSDFNYLSADASANGQVKNGAVDFKTPCNTWYQFDDMGNVCGTNGVYLEFSTRKVKGTCLHLSFDIAAGNGNLENSQLYPYEWKVEYSLDGKEWTLVKDNVTGRKSFAVRTIPTWTKQIGKTKYPTQYDCGFGLQQHNFELPAEVIGKDKVIVKISPASEVLSVLHPSSDKSSKLKSDNSNVAKSTNRTNTNLRFGTIRIDYK